MGLSTEVDDVVAIIQAVATPVNAAYGDYITPILGSEDFDSTVEIITALLDAGTELRIHNWTTSKLT